MGSISKVQLYREIKQVFRQQEAPFVMRGGESGELYCVKRGGLWIDDVTLAFKIERYFMTHRNRSSRVQGWYSFIARWYPFIHVLPVFDGLRIFKNGVEYSNYEGVCRTSLGFIYVWCDCEGLHSRPASVQALSVAIRRCI